MHDRRSRYVCLVGAPGSVLSGNGAVLENDPVSEIEVNPGGQVFLEDFRRDLTQRRGRSAV